MDHFDISFVIWKLSRSRDLTKPTLLDPDHFPGSHPLGVIHNTKRFIFLKPRQTPSYALVREASSRSAIEMNKETHEISVGGREEECIFSLPGK